MFHDIHCVDYNKPIMSMYTDFNSFQSKNEIAREWPLLLTNPDAQKGSQKCLQYKCNISRLKSI